MVLVHSQRSCVWSVILALHDRISFDEELLWIASLLHDLGFVDRGVTAKPECFTIVGARAAMAFDSDGWDDKRRRTAAEAITIHLNLRVDLSHGPVAHLLWAGTRLDAVGLRYWDLAPATVAAVLERYPRLDLKGYFPAVFEKEAALVPGSRTQFYNPLPWRQPSRSAGAAPMTTTLTAGPPDGRAPWPPAVRPDAERTRPPDAPRLGGRPRRSIRSQYVPAYW